MDTDEECSIVLELAKNDPFFDKKKELLQCKGFSPKEQIYFRSSSKPGWTTATVNVLLQIARIIQLNEGVVERDYSCSRVEHLIEWGESNGVRTELKIAYVEGAGRGAIARKDLRVGDIALEIPVSIIISEELVYETDMIDRTGRIPMLRLRDRESYVQNKTKEYDDTAMKYLSYVLFLLVVGFSIYSLMYERHKSWYSWILSSLTSCVYMFGKHSSLSVTLSL
ncbi:hypothetical protein RIF29_10729 [Crotalaria pallida]|uniref:Uncharacterized protein n=1 Tax=Crotalaria pallida TaxID=3830 RepID=A0AAN9FZ61_CROPI